MNPSQVALASFLVLAFIGCAEAVYRCRWEIFKRQYSKYYLSIEEEELRFSIFRYNIRELQKEPRNANITNLFNLKGINRNSDLNQAESKWKNCKGKTRDERARNSYLDALKARSMIEPGSSFPTRKPRPRFLGELPLGFWGISVLIGAEIKPPPPDYVDLDLRDCLTPVRDQGACNACFAFATVAVLECSVYRKTGRIVELSEQNIIDCTKDVNFGCNGGWAHKAFEYVIKNKGISKAKYYPYTERDDDKCKFKREHAEPMQLRYKKIKEGSEEELKEALHIYGAVVVSMDLKGYAYDYIGARDVYNNATCETHNNNHAVVVAGYGTIGGVDYWLIRNSYGSRWGDRGYFKTARNQNNRCGVATYAYYVL